MRKYGSALLAPALAALALAACDGGSGGTGSGGARLTIRLTDAPGDLKEAWVKIEEIYLQGSSGADSVNSRVVLTDGPSAGYVDLLTLSGGNFATVVNGEPVPAGTYSQLRLVVCEAYVVTRSGDVYATRDADLPAGVTADGELRAPSACQSGFKVKLPGGALTLEEGSTILSVDFDVSQSFGHQAGNSGRWIMHPVLQATEVGLAGRISGTVAVAQGVTLPTCGGAAVDVTKFGPLATAGVDSLTGVVNTAGQYSITVAPATYTMGYLPVLSYTNGDSLTFTAAATPASAAVASGATVTSNYSITAATCKVKTQ